MAIRRTDQLKRFFKKGAYPTETQFGDMIESMRHKLEGVPMADVEGLSAALNGKADGNDTAEAIGSLAGSLTSVRGDVNRIKEFLRHVRAAQDEFSVDFGEMPFDVSHFDADIDIVDSIAGNTNEGDIVYVRVNGEEYRTRVLQIEEYAVLLIEVCRKEEGVWIWELGLDGRDSSRRRI